ncbi:MAG: hypothetical protein HY401_03485 [Elusimicrobia bacterium]|nr:hypothetical protein [Elusimicrobiota bacterium]
MKDFAIAISVYDKFDNVKILVDMIRKNWQGDFDIIVCSSHRDPYPHLSGCDIDHLLVTENIPYQPSYSPEQQALHLTLRVVDSIRKSCSKAAQSSAPYGVHIHSDCIPLSWPHLRSLGETMKRHGKYFAARGQYGQFNQDVPMGALDDMFFVFDNRFAQAKGLWEFDLLDFLPHRVSMHGFLAFLSLARVGLRNTYLYSQYEDDLLWDGRQATSYCSRVGIPMSLNSKFHFLHLHESSFEGDLGLNLKAYYLQEYGLTKGAAVESFIDRYGMDKEVLFEKLKNSEEELLNFFKNKGLNRLASVTYSREPIYLRKIRDRYLKSSLLGKARWLAHRHGAQVKNAVIEFCKYKFWESFLAPMHYRDAMYPSSLTPVYRKALAVKPGDVAELDDLSFGVSPALWPPKDAHLRLEPPKPPGCSISDIAPLKKQFASLER